MGIPEAYRKDAEAILALQTQFGSRLWTTPDNRLMKGSPFTMLSSAQMLLELGMSPDEPVLKAVAEKLFSVQREDGRFQVYPTGAIYPCHTIHALLSLCHLGFAGDPRLAKTFRHLLETRYRDGGWRCNKFSFGRGPETEGSNPGPTLAALDAFRFWDGYDREPALLAAVEMLLTHWTTKKPMGPCQYGIGSRFMQVEYPLGSYNLFTYVYVLSFYPAAQKDARFAAALRALGDKTVRGQMTVERVNPKLKSFAFCGTGPNEMATKRYAEIGERLRRADPPIDLASRLPIRFETERCRIRPFQEEDLDAFMAYRNDLEWMRFQGFKGLTREAFGAALLGEQNLAAGVQLAMTDALSGQLIGDLYVRQTGDICWIGYTVSPPKSGQGYAGEAVIALLAWLRQNGVRRVRAAVCPENEPSVRLLLRCHFDRAYVSDEGETIYELNLGCP